MRQLFKDKELHDEFQTNGFVIVDVFNKNEIEDFRIRSLQLLDQFKNIIPNRYFPVGQSNDYDFRNVSTKLIHDDLLKKIQPLFQNASVYSGTHLIKPRGKNSFLATHQDSSIVDEQNFSSILMWCPLQNINLLNGRLYVLKGSHLFENHYRSTTIPWLFKNVQAILYKYSKPITINAGQVCFFHSALIHHSGYNYFNKYRIAASAIIIDEEADILNYFYNAELARIEAYKVNMEYYHNTDFNKPPDKSHLIKNIPYSIPKMESYKIKQLINTYSL